LTLLTYLIIYKRTARSYNSHSADFVVVFVGGLSTAQQ
jgi:hypothetical protein